MIYGIDRAFDEERRKGIKEGEKKGEEKGEKKEKFKIAEKLLKKGAPIQEIIELTELTEKEILQVKSTLKDVL